MKGIDRVFVEKSVATDPLALSMLKQLGRSNNFHVIDDYENYFGQFKKPYLHKRTNLDIYIAKKKGQLVKEAPPAYGLKGEPHYYFIHAYNCIYECEYCYLQGYFNSPDLVLFINRADIAEQIITMAEQHAGNQSIWFHAGEFSDSLALSHITNECQFYWETFAPLKNCKLELRTKSANIKAIRDLSPQPNIITSFSMSPDRAIKEFDLKTPRLNARINAMAELQQLGHPVAIHFDPIIASDSTVHDYQQLIAELDQRLDLSNVEYFSLGVVRFTKDVYHQLEKNYPKSKILASELIKTQDNLYRYSRPHRLQILTHIKDLLLDLNLEENKIYLCMED